MLASEEIPRNADLAIGTLEIDNFIYFPLKKALAE
jgi:hypothetical protein